MLIRQRKASDPKPSEITPQSTYVNRRRILAAAGFAGVAGAGLMLGLGGGKGDGVVGAISGIEGDEDFRLAHVSLQCGTCANLLRANCL